MQASYSAAAAGRIPDALPAEMYCHTLTDDSILSPELRGQGFQTLTLFGFDMPYRLFTRDHDARKAEVKRRYLAGLNRILAEPIEECLARDASGELCLEIKTPQDLERELDLDLGNIFHNAPSWFFTDDPGPHRNVGRGNTAPARLSLRVVCAPWGCGERDSGPEHGAEDLRRAGCVGGVRHGLAHL